ncbi:RNA-binding S4 domain-containing protein [Chitinilyticum aquatile]|uniref:RNA-binding S4 domain-containing protein n=1 Tax=Chitinilyticum aquatile TaxID=362520 RepID=UPI0003F9B1E9|nr:RNA-binding S4 domain-containing protein [Chitinilyticum aquatile]
MQAFEVELDQEYIALNDLLKITGVVDTGGAGKLMVASGVVQVDGQQELRKTCKIRPGQVVEVDGEVRITVLQMPPEE